MAQHPDFVETISAILGHICEEEKKKEEEERDENGNHLRISLYVCLLFEIAEW